MGAPKNSKSKKQSSRNATKTLRKGRGGKSSSAGTWIGVSAVAVIVAIIAVGVVITAQKTAVQAAGYGYATQTTASTSPDIGAITVGDSGAQIVLDVYKDPLCPSCQAFENQYGQQIAKALDNGKIRINYHMVNFLDGQSASGTYSSRTDGALLAVADLDGNNPGVWSTFHAKLYEKDVTPTEGGSDDLDNAELADLAEQAGANDKATTAIEDGTYVTQAKQYATKSLAQLRAAAAAAGTTAGTPAVLQSGTYVNIGSTTWLTDLLEQHAPDVNPTGTRSVTPLDSK